MGEQVMLFSSAVMRGPVGEQEVERLRARAMDCQMCRLSQSRKNVVFGVGKADEPPVAFVGEGPGAVEDSEGTPFVGPAGQLLDQMLSAMELRREEVFITNCVLCRPPENRKPHPHEVGACREFLLGQLRAVHPKIVVALGGSAAQALLGTKKRISALMGEWHEWEGTPVRATFHPAYLLREPSQKRKAWDDLQAVMLRLGIVK
jgi:uracil-DNA glycosylase family 4